MTASDPDSSSGSQRYDAFAFHPGFGGRTARGWLISGREGFEFKSDLGHVVLPWQGLVVRLGGHNSEQIFLEHPAAPGWSIYTSDRTILQHEAIKNDPAAQAQIGAAKRSWRFAPALVIFAIVVTLAIGVVVLLFAQKDRAVRFLANQIPIAWEQNLGEQLLNQIKSQGQLVSDPALGRQVDAVTKRLLPVVAQTGYRFEFHILADTNINAFAIPGGHIVIHTGLLRATSKPEELAGVLAHEIAHVTQRHGFRKVIDTAGLSLLLQAVFGDVSGILGVIASSSEFLLRQKYSRDFEREADDAGWDYLLAAEIDPRGMVDFFSKLKAQERGPQLLAFASTHPATQERIERLERKWKKRPEQAAFIPIELAEP